MKGHTNMFLALPIGRYHVTFNHRDIVRDCGRFVVEIWILNDANPNPRFLAGSYYDSTFLDLHAGSGLQMMGGILNASEVAGIQDAIRTHAAETR
jgi:hypothetical protein